MNMVIYIHLIVQKMNRNSKYINRLVREWEQHGKIVLAIDWDSTLEYWNTIENQEDIEKVRTLVSQCQQVGTYNVIHSACKKERYSEIIEKCKQMNIKVDAINENPIDLPYGGNGSKIFYNHQLCDRSGLLDSIDILETALYIHKGNIQNNKPLLEIG